MPNSVTINASLQTHDSSRSEKRSALVATVCPNCGSDGIGQFCPRCGQERTTSIVPVIDLVRDAADELLKYDSKLFVTLRALILRPGFLTAEYLSGRRAAYIAPFRLYFWISALFFFAYSYSAQHQLEHSFQFPAAGNASLVTHYRDSATPTQPVVKAVAPPRGNPQAAAFRRATLRRRIADKIARTGSRFASGFATHLATIFIVMIPGCALILRSLYWRTRRYYTEFFVFTLHIQSVSLILSIPAALSNDFLFWNSRIGLTLGTVYTYLALMYVFRQSPLKTAIKTVLYVAGYMLLSGLAGFLVFMILLLLS